MIGRRIPDVVVLSQIGQIRSDTNKKWVKFGETESYTVAQPEFEWSATLRFAGLGLGRATDTLTDGHGRMHVRLLGILNVVDAEGPEMDQGALTR